ncbi:unnamed protein product [Strongylus vulgaris]|uniref:ILCR1 Ig-like domain-containing protein n=1 Tax=Strongylus vulgaris TaxID=40348 RepID=A0A3P7IVZ0_STRVU|nr:unnamed protein product [Strongylus vulgaris]
MSSASTSQHEVELPGLDLRLISANTEASKWTAAFRRIFLQSIARTIQIEFVGAPPHFCFEEYEVRLLDETGIELLHHTTIKAKDMKKEIIDGKVVYFGEHNFTGLEVGDLILRERNFITE